VDITNVRTIQALIRQSASSWQLTANVRCMTVDTTAVDLSKSAIRARAVAFAKRWEGTTSESSEKQTFWNELMGLFGIDRRQVSTFEELAKRASTGNIGWIDFLFPGEMAVEQKSRGADLNQAMGQLLDYLPSLHKSAFPWFLVVCDFAEFQWKNLDTGEEGSFLLADLAHNIDVFWWLAGYKRPGQEFADEEEANLAATALMAKIHDGVLDANYDPHHLRVWLTRILFCLFADDTDVWDRNAFTNYLHLHTSPDGLDLGPQIGQLFQLLNTPPEKRSKHLDEELASFTYINGDLFSEDLPTPFCNEGIRNVLLEACRFDWSAISPAIFGSMFQNVMTPLERRELGAHYTTEENILKTIRPLFLDDLETELKAASSRPALLRFHDRLSSLTFLDPACGCGNFLVLAYRELRRLETETLRKLAQKEGRTGYRSMDLSLVCKVSVDQFYGIEIEEFPARIARTALYLMDHKCNRDVSAEFGQHFARFPIPASPHIVIDNALRIDWERILPAEDADFVFGNPPFVGMAMMNREQQEDNRIVFDDRATKELRTGRLDYVACWYEKAIQYAKRNPVRSAFVSTNSISQGEQARTFSGLLAKRGYSVSFAHRTFAWSSEAKGKAHVHVVIIGFSEKSLITKRRLFDYEDLMGPPIETAASNINAYLVDAPDVALGKHTSPFFSLPVPTEGNRPEDGGGLIFSDEEARSLRAQYPEAAPYLRRLLGARDLLRGESRWCLWCPTTLPKELRQVPPISRRLAKVRDARLASTAKTTSTQRQEKMGELALTPYRFAAIRQPTKEYVCMPRVSSERRRVIPMVIVEPEVIAGDTTLTLTGAPLWLFGILQSAMFMAWVRTVCGRLKSDIRLAPDLAYNAFPFPDVDEAGKVKASKAAQEILQARAAHPDLSLADLYDPLSMPVRLVKAHDDLDRIVDALFAPRRKFKGDADRLAVLFERYDLLSGPLLAKPKKGRRKV